MNLYSNAGSLWQPGILKKYLSILLLQLLCTSGLFAQAVKQEKTISLTYKEVSATVLFKELKQQTGYDFNFSPAELDQVKIGPLEYKNTPLEKVLKDLEQHGLSFHQAGNIISVSYKKPAPKSPNVQAGSGPGTIKGRIVEFETSQPVPAASVYIVELKRGGQSDNNGYYRFTGLPSGKYTLQVSYVGFTTENQPVEIKAGKEETYDIKLQGSNTLGEVVVTAVGKTRRPVAHTSEKQVLEEVKSASVVVSAISSEQISKSADRNAAEAVSKVAGVSVVDDKFVIVRGLNPRYNLTYLNDNVAPSTEVYSRAFALDLIPSRIIDRIMVYKSAGPETLADATGGVVKIYTKDAKTVKHFDLELQLGHRQGTTFNNNFLTYNGGKFDFLGFDDGTRKLPSSVPRYNQLALAKLRPSQYANTFNPTLTHQRTTALPNIQLTANYYNAFSLWGRTLSTLTSLSYKNEYQKNNVYSQEGYERESDAAYFHNRTSYDDRNTQTAQLNLLQNFSLKLRGDSSILFFKNFILQQGQDASIVRVSHRTAGTRLYPFYDKDNILSFNQRFLYAGNLGGMHYDRKGLHKLQWNGGYTISRQNTPDQRVVRFTAPAAWVATGDTSLAWKARGYNYDYDLGDPKGLALGIISRFWMRNFESVYNGSIDYTFNWKPWLSFKVGTFQQWKERQLYRRVYTVHEGDNQEAKGQFGPGSGRYLNPELVRFREQALGNVWSENYLRDDLTGLLVVDKTSGSDSYLGTEQNNSGYFAVHFTPLNKKVEVYGGLRYEYNRQQIGAAIPKSNENTINRPVYIDNPMRTWLPSINASWRPSDSWVVRGAFGKTVNRTEFREVAPYQELDYVNNIKIGGNPELISATVDNYDLRIEFYPQGNAKGETISAGVFYKEIINPIERINTSIRSLKDFPSISYQNAESATVKGVEVELQKRLDFIPGSLFRNFSIIANASFIRSEAVTDTVSLSSLSFVAGKRPLQGQAPYIINAGLYYDNIAWGTKISAIYNTKGNNLYAVGRGYRKAFYEGPLYRGGLIELSRHTVDIAVSQRLIKTLQLKLSVQNLLNQKIRMAEDFNFTNKYEPLHDTGSVNAAGSPVTDGDNIASSYNPGRYFVLNLSYSF